MKRPLVTLPNGSHLKYASGPTRGSMFGNDLISGERVANWDLFEDIEIPSDHTLEDKKINLKKAYKLNLWSSGTSQHVICADFDKRPKRFKDFDEFIEHLNWQYDNAVVTRSRRGRAKAFFVVELPPKVDMSKQIAELTLQEILEPKLFKIIDRRGLEVTWLTPEMKSALQSRLHLLQPLQAVLPDKFDKPLRVSSGRIPPTLRNFIHSGTKSTEYEKREKFIRILMDTPLLRDTFYISTTRLGSECDVKPMTISRWRNELVKMGQLILLDSQYFMGKRAKAYKASGELLEILPSVPEKGVVKDFPTRKPPPTNIEDGQWNEAMFEAIKYYRGDEDLIWAWFKSCPGHQLKDRSEHLKARLKSYQLYLSKKRA